MSFVPVLFKINILQENHYDCSKKFWHNFFFGKLETFFLFILGSFTQIVLSLLFLLNWDFSQWTIVVYFDKLSGAARTRKLIEAQIFKKVISFTSNGCLGEGIWNKKNKKGWKRLKKVLQPAFECAQHPKAGCNTHWTIHFVC